MKKILLLIYFLILISSNCQDINKSDLNNKKTKQNSGLADSVYDYIQCQICHVPALSGGVKDCYCNYETVDKSLNNHFHPLLQKLIKLPFFRYYKVNLSKECPFWQQDDAMCSSRECAVCECPQEEIPILWNQIDNNNNNNNKNENKKHRRIYHKYNNNNNNIKPIEPCLEQEGEGELSKVDKKANEQVGEYFRGWKENEIDTTTNNNNNDNDNNDNNMIYVNLLVNKERFTGYSGIHAENVWRAIYNENCFLPPSGKENDLSNMCLEERVFYRLISGLHTSINTHIAQEYKNLYTNEWSYNTKLYINRVGKYPERLENLYFTYVFIMRAIGRAKNMLLKYNYDTGNKIDDKKTVYLLNNLLNIESSNCSRETHAVLEGFNENQLFLNEKDNYLHDQFVNKFNNITKIMDCVTCEKCRLWGKIQIMGMNTAVKIILSNESNIDNVVKSLHRNEIIALFNLIARLSESVESVRYFREKEFQEAIYSFILTISTVVICFIIIFYIIRMIKQKNIIKMKKKMKNKIQ